MKPEDTINRLTNMANDIHSSYDDAKHISKDKQLDIYALAEAIKHLTWIPVTKELPKEHLCDDGWYDPSDYVIICSTSGLQYISRCWKHRKVNFDHIWIDVPSYISNDIIAWRPCLESYKGETE